MAKEESVKPTNFTRQQIEEIADLVRKQLHFIPGTTNIAELVASLNGTIETNNGLIESEGGSIITPGNNNKAFTIYLPSYTEAKRNDFTIAHELGHFILHSEMGRIPLKANFTGDDIRVENECNTFAAQLLMPEDLFTKEFTSNNNKLHLAKTFNVSLSLILWRCEDLSLK